MSLKKRFTGDFTIEAIDSGGTVIIDGDLAVLGTSTTIDSTNTTIVDNIIVLNSGETGNGVSLNGTTAGLEIDRGIAAGGAAGLRFNEATDIWEVNPGTGSWVAIATGAAGITDIIQDITPQLGANLDVNNFSITSAGGGDVVIVADTGGNASVTADGVTVTSTVGDVVMSAAGVVKVNQELSLLEQTAPGSLAGYNKFYANTPAEGGTGLYFVNTTETDELVSKKKAIAYGIIF